MPEVFALLFICLAAIAAGGFMIHYFWLIPLKKAFARAAFFVCIFLVFWASGAWVNASRHSWGVLAPLFAVFIGLGWLGCKYGPGFLKWLYLKITRYIDNGS